MKTLSTHDRAALLTAFFTTHYWAHPEAAHVFVAALSIERCGMTTEELEALVEGDEKLGNRCPILASAVGYLVTDECLEGLPDWRRVGEVWPLPAFWMPRQEGEDVPTTE